MDQSIVNAVSPFEGRLHWVGQVASGQSQNTGNPWKRVDFTIAYTDLQMQQRFITFSLSGVEKVDRLLSTPLGTVLRVTWKPVSNEYQGKWYSRNDAVGFYAPQAQQSAQNVQQPQYGQQYAPQQAPAQPQYPPQYQQPYQPQGYQPGAGFYPPQAPVQNDDMPDFR